MGCAGEGRPRPGGQEEEGGGGAGGRRGETGPVRPPAAGRVAEPPPRGGWGGCGGERYYVTVPFRRLSRPPAGRAAVPPATRSARERRRCWHPPARRPQAAAVSSPFTGRRAPRRRVWGGKRCRGVGRMAAQRGGVAGLQPRPARGEEGCLPRFTAGPPKRIAFPLISAPAHPRVKRASLLRQPAAAL